MEDASERLQAAEARLACLRSAVAVAAGQQAEVEKDSAAKQHVKAEYRQRSAKYTKDTLNYRDSLARRGFSQEVGGARVGPSGEA